jgi:Zn-dependent protease with chaperone function
MGKMKNRTKSLSSFKALFISDPDRAEIDSAALSTMNVSSGQKLVQDILSQQLTTGAKFAEVFSTHPNIIKRLKALQELD